MNCVICHSHIYDEYLILDEATEQFICLNCDDPETISNWKEETQSTWQDVLNKSRRSEGWYGCIVGNGWRKIVLEADQMLSRIDPDYKIHQVKEKFGTLRFYYGSEKTGVDRKIMDAIVESAERKSHSICEDCGAYNAKLRTERYWTRTLCDSCNDKVNEKLNEVV
jgi:hypothetical protein